MESGRKPYELQRVDARALAERVARDFGAEVAPRGYRVTLDADVDDVLTVEADAESLAHALWNLLDNAVKYSPDERDILVSVRPHGTGVAFAVTDRGLGIPASERSEIFDRFVRGARARELGIRGTGLGLAMVQHIVRAHRGRVEVESQEGAGSTFRVVLPAAA
jgi:signal transduction histidine kinase